MLAQQTQSAFRQDARPDRQAAFIDVKDGAVMRTVDRVFLRAEEHHRAARLLGHEGEVLASHHRHAMPRALLAEQIVADRPNKLSDSRIVVQGGITRRDIQLIVAAEMPRQGRKLLPPS